MSRARGTALALALIVSVAVWQAPAAEATGSCTAPINGKCAHWFNYDGVNGADAVAVDYTGSLWPVSTASTLYNGFTAHWHYFYRYYTQGCPAPHYCFPVEEINAPPYNWAGRYQYNVDQYGIIQNDGRPHVSLNDAYAPTSATKRQTACHELGHMVGLNHNPDADSCLQEVVNGNAPNPNQSDKNVVIWVYTAAG